jgi:Tyrosyl-DNA phosphodiesterase
VEEFPSIFQKNSSIPCIVLHGTKGITKDMVEQQLARPDLDKHNTEGDSATDNDDDSVLGNANDIENCINGSVETRRLSDHVYFSEIKTTWLPQIPASFNDVVCKETGFLRPEIIEQRRSKRGVHHPKFMILLEETGSIVVVISTLNLTRSKRSIDGSWIQRFPPLEIGEGIRRVAEDSVGAELARLLQYQTLATAPEQMTAYAFVKRYMGWSSIFDLSTHYDYQQACVHLVMTVPGDYTCASFGQQRLSAVTRKLPFALVSDNDRLIIQPTSIGAEWKDDGVANLVRSYLQLDAATYRDALHRLDIVWPTAHFIRNAGESRSTVDPTFSPKRRGSGKEQVKSNEQMKGFIFLSSATFNRIDVDCLSRMIMYEPCERQQRVMSPHFKSVVRLFQGSDYRIRKEYGFPKCKDLFSWFLLTSACLSKGAQGERDGDTVAYANFELGVLFSSRHGGDRCSNNRIYCLKPERCACSTDGSLVEAELIALPVPYCPRAPSYTENYDDATFCETPFFHEITPETAACGNMQLTPYGKALCIQTTKVLR